MKNEKGLNQIGISTLAIAGLFALVSCLAELKAQTPRNCSEIHFSNPSAPSGVYTIDPDGSGPLSSIDCQCDMTTDGGGWTLVLNYNHLVNTNPALKVFTDNLPLQGQTTLGTDESNTIYWGHAGTAIMNEIPFDEVRFYGFTSDHSRVMNFKTSHTGTVSYFKTGIGSTEGISTNFTPLDGHNTYLPAAINMTITNMGDYAMTAYPLWTGSTYHWYLAGSDPLCSQRWEVDNYPCTTPSTFHQIWVRQNTSLGVNSIHKNTLEMHLSPNPFSDIAKLTTPNSTPGQFEQTRISIYNIWGIEVHPVIIRNQGYFIIEKGSVAPGIYYCRLAENTGASASIKMIIQ